MIRFGTPPVRGKRYTDRAGAYAVIVRAGQMLVTEQREPWVEIQLPGGGIDPGESPLAALHRETREETGWTIRPVRRLGVYQRFTFMPEYDLWARKICHIYLCTPGRQLGPPSEPGHTEFWMPAEEAIPALASQGDAHFASRALSPGICRVSNGAGRASKHDV